MASMSRSYGRDLDLNLLRVFSVVAACGSVTRAAAQLYLTQPAVSAAIRRLSTAIGTAIFVRQGRRLVLSPRGEQLLESTRPHLAALVDGALTPPRFDPKTSDRTVRIGLSDSSEAWLLPRLLRALTSTAPKMRIVALPVQFRNVASALTTRSVDMAVTVADEMPAGIRRRPLLTGGFVCLYDRRHPRIRRKLTDASYFGSEHVIVSYNGDLRGIVEDLLRKKRNVRCSVSSFYAIGDIIEGSTLLATVPALVADRICARHPALTTAPLPFRLETTSTELLWPIVTEDDAPCRFIREELVRLASFDERAGRDSKRRAQRSTRHRTST
jgi:LysR family transcriptional regulator, mexEF-oprN operon transcriptional activator